jgi:hypothetical protein
LGDKPTFSVVPSFESSPNINSWAQVILVLVAITIVPVIAFMVPALPIMAIFVLTILMG